MEDSIILKIVGPNTPLTDLQYKQVNQVIKDGIEEKFFMPMAHMVDRIPQIIDILIKDKLLPMDEIYCALDSQTSEVLSIVLLNNFKNPSLHKLLIFAFKALRLMGIRTGSAFLKCFSMIDAENKKLGDKNFIAEIYLVSTRKDLRGKGIGTELLNCVISDLKSKCKCNNGADCICRIKLLVFRKNPAVHLYQRLNFTPTGGVKTDKLACCMGSDYDELIQMERQLVT